MQSTQVNSSLHYHKKMSSDDERESKKQFRYEGGDWRRLTSRIKPVLYAKKSEPSAIGRPKGGMSHTEGV